MSRFSIALCVALGLSAGLVAGSASATTKAAGIVSADDDPTMNATETLLSSIAAGDRERCYQIDKDNAFNGDFKAAVTGIQCDAPGDGIQAVLYFQYDDPAKLAADYTASYETGLGPATDGTTCDGTNTWSYTGDTPGGDYACFDKGGGGGSRIVWTATTPKILGLSEATDGAALIKWFNSSSGPLSAPDTVTNFGTGTQAEYHAATKALLAKVHKTVTGCKSKLGLVAPGDPEWAWYPWLQAAEACDAPQHGSVYLAQLDPKSAQAYEAYFTRNVIIGNTKTSTPKACADQDITDDKNKVVGSVGCVYAGKLLYAVWYTSDDGVVGAAHVNTTPKKLFAYVNKYHLL